MKVGFQTISWGRRLDNNGEPMLKAIAKAGYDGVEIMQHPKEFGSAKQLYQYLKDFNLKLLGLTGGSVKERSDFIRKLINIENRALLHEEKSIIKVIRFDKNHPYIYIDTWVETYYHLLVTQRLPLALHPHMFKPIQTAKEVEKLLQKYPALKFVPDTAHLTIAGEDVRKVIEDNFKRVVAVHLKDWSSEFGRSYQFYSRGFCIRFGHGDVKLNKIVDFLKSKRYKNWLVVEQDVTDDPQEAARLCRSWLRNNHNI